jgi:acyl-CoA synthetase (AMP-forming)/AMP-acid ligase II
VSTSGSTGGPRFVVNTQVRTSPGRPRPARLTSRLDWRPGQRQLVLGPLGHASSLPFFIHGVGDGNTIVIADEFDPTAMLHLVGQERIEWMQLTPYHLRRLRTCPAAAGADLSSLRALLHMSAGCPASDKRYWHQRLGARRVFGPFGSRAELEDRIGAILADELTSGWPIGTVIPGTGSMSGMSTWSCLSALEAHPAINDVALLPDPGCSRTSVLIVPQGLQMGSVASADHPGLGATRRVAPGCPRPGHPASHWAVDVAAAAELVRSSPYVFPYELPATLQEAALVAELEELFPEVAVSMTDDLAGLGGDSLAAIQLSEALFERHGVTVDPADLFAAASIRDVARLVFGDEAEPQP